MTNILKCQVKVAILFCDSDLKLLWNYVLKYMTNLQCISSLFLNY